ncbi:hypothetical protein Tco_0595036 [Tanacetum coccineum]
MFVLKNKHTNGLPKRDNEMVQDGINEEVEEGVNEVVHRHMNVVGNDVDDDGISVKKADLRTFMEGENDLFKQDNAVD